MIRRKGRERRKFWRKQMKKADKKNEEGKGER